MTFVTVTGLMTRVPAHNFMKLLAALRYKDSMRLSLVLLFSSLQTTCHGEKIFDDPVSLSKNCLYDRLKVVKPKGGLNCHSSNLEVSNVMAAKRERCNPGSNVTLTVKADIDFPSERRDFGWYVSTDGGTAKHGTCYLRAMTSPAFLDAIVQDKRNGYAVGQVEWLIDTSRGYADECGDIVMTSGGGGVLRNVLLFANLEVPCVDTNDDTKLDIGICFTWHESGNDDFCIKDFLYPGAPSLCHCKRIEISEVSVDKLSTETTTE